MSDRQINEAGLKLIMSEESLECKAYRDTGGVLTIGYGHTGPDVHEGMVITEEEAEDLLYEDLDWAEQVVCDVVSAPLTDNEFAALVSFAFNIGPEAFRSSTLAAHVNKRIYDDVPRQLKLWIHDEGKVVQGLINRRNKEIVLWNTPDPANEEA